ncbi:hypothetical protein E1218_02510 [Kribbella turkmenica]|uniref:Integrase catalytic domain-containing protein n=1 Tax=Kribbella turkmenica TaxID=2530375 RepID=A0A4R4XGS7_9ACTN|nr:hypothetical protein E1218_02510 [Kribbella turkmenica]
MERFQQTMKNWLRAQSTQPATPAELQVLLDTFAATYNQHRPHRSLPHRATIATIYATLPRHSRPAPAARHPRPDPARPHRSDRLHHPATRRPTPPHGHRPNRHRNPRHPARPGPKHPGGQRHHR